MKDRLPILILLILSFEAVTAHAANPAIAQRLLNQKDWSFTENRGQLPSPNTNFPGAPTPKKSPSPLLKKGGYASNNGIRYYGRQGGVSVYCSPGKISFVFAKPQREPNSPNISEGTGERIPLFQKGAGGFGSLKHQIYTTKITAAHAALTLLHANPNAQIIASDQQEYYENFYTQNTGDTGIAHVRTYKTVTYKDIYPYIDLVLQARDGGLKYEFVVRPGGKVSDIQMQWNGLENMKMTAGGGMFYGLELGQMTESAPYTYAVGTGLAPARIPSSFATKKSSVGFRVGRYDKTKTLVIDPTLDWATYFGGSGFNIGYDIATDLVGNVLVTGSTTSPDKIASNGAWQSSYSDSDDVFLAKFSPLGKLLWSTYYGGNGNDDAVGIAVDKDGNACIYGITSSNTGIASLGAYEPQIINRPNTTISFVAKFNAAGNRIWGTYFNEGFDDDNFLGKGIAMDSSGDIFITGYAESHTGIGTSGTYMSSVSAQENGSFVVKFSSSGNPLWGTYFGNKGTFSSGIGVDDMGNCFITGQTYLDSGIASAGAFQTKFGGGMLDGFLAKFSPSGARLWSTLYGGAGTDEVANVGTDQYGNSYILGTSNSDTGLTSSGAFYTKPNGTFIAKFSPTGQRLWGTYSSATEYVYGLAISKNGLVYITGSTESDSGVATAGAYESTLHGLGSVFLQGYSTKGSLLWGSYLNGDTGYGGIAVGIAVDNNSQVCIIGYTGDSGLATHGAYQTDLDDGEDAFIAKVNFTYQYDAGIAAFASPYDTICPGTNPIAVSLKNYGSKALDSVDIYWQINGKRQPVYHWSGNLAADSTANVMLGSYNFALGSTDTFKAWTGPPNGYMDSIPENDSATLVVAVQRPIVITGPPQKICSGTAIQLGAAPQPGRSYQWTSSPPGFGSAIANPTDSPKTTTVYLLKTTMNATGCADSGTVVVTVAPAPFPSFNIQNIAPYSYEFAADSPGYPASHYLWDFGPDTAKGNTAVHTYPQNGSYEAYLTVTIPGFCSKTDSQLVNVGQPFSLDIYPNPFSTVTDIRYALPSPGHVRISVNDAIGREIAVLKDIQLPQGYYDTPFDATRLHTRSGIYFVVFELNGKAYTRKIVQVDSMFY